MKLRSFLLLFFVSFCTFGASLRASDVLPPVEVLQSKLLEVGREMGLTQTYQDSDEGIFVWRVKLSPAKPKKNSADCDALFMWYLKPVENQIAMDDPMFLLCAPKPEIVAATRPFQLEFKRRWVAAVGGATFTPHVKDVLSAPLVGTLMALLSTEKGPRSELPLPPAPQGFTWRPLREINAAVLVPEGWHVKRVISPDNVSSSIAYFVSLEDIDAGGSFNTGLSVNVFLPKGQPQAVESNMGKLMATACATGAPLKPLWQSDSGKFHTTGCLVRLAAKDGPVIVDHRVVLNTATKKAYYLVFETPESRWDEAWAKWSKVVEMLSFDGNI